MSRRFYTETFNGDVERMDFMAKRQFVHVKGQQTITEKHLTDSWIPNLCFVKLNSTEDRKINFHWQDVLLWCQKNEWNKSKKNSKLSIKIADKCSSISNGDRCWVLVHSSGRFWGLQKWTDISSSWYFKNVCNIYLHMYILLFSLLLSFDRQKYSERETKQQHSSSTMTDRLIFCCIFKCIKPPCQNVCSIRTLEWKRWRRKQKSRKCAFC